MRHLFLFSLLVGLWASSARPDTTVVVIHFQTVFEEYGELQRLDREFRGEVETFREDQQASVTALQEKQQAFAQLRQEASQPEVTDEQRAAFAEQASVLLEELNAEDQRIRQERQQFQQELEAKGVRLRRRIVDDVRRRIESLASTQGWDVILDSSANGQNGLPVVHMASPELDKTRWVITELNKALSREGGDPE